MTDATREFVRLEVADGVATMRLDRPKMNALDVQMQEEIRGAALEATERDDVRAVVVWGGERVFAAGADVKEMADMSYTDMVKRSGGLQSEARRKRRLGAESLSKSGRSFPCLRRQPLQGARQVHHRLLCCRPGDRRMEGDVQGSPGFRKDVDLGAVDEHAVRLRAEHIPRIYVLAIYATERDVQIKTQAVRGSDPDRGVLDDSRWLALCPLSVTEPAEHPRRALDGAAWHEQVDVCIEPWLLWLV